MHLTLQVFYFSYKIQIDNNHTNHNSYAYMWLSNIAEDWGSLIGYSSRLDLCRDIQFESRALE